MSKLLKAEIAIKMRKVHQNLNFTKMMHVKIFVLFLKVRIAIKVRKFTKFDLIFLKVENANRVKKLTKLAFFKDRKCQESKKFTKLAFFR